MSGKGDKRRPRLITYKEYEENWEKIFRNEKEQNKFEIEIPKENENKENTQKDVLC